MNTRRSGWLVLIVAAAVVTLGGCVKPLFSPDEPRSQFDRFDAVREQRAAQYTFDEFGTRRPNLRARLLARD